MTYYNMAISYGVDGGRVEPIESTKGQWAKRDDAEQLEKERDKFERKCGELCQAHGTLLIKFHDAAKDAVDMAKVVLTHPCLMYSHREQANAIIERYGGGKG